MSHEDAMPAMTLRQMAGLGPASTIDAASTALLLIDFQREYADGGLALNADAAGRQAERLMNAADRIGLSVVHVHHVAANSGAKLFRPGSRGVLPWPNLQPQPQHRCIEKQLPSAFAGTDLDAGLRAAGIEVIVVAGLMTHMCVDSTARDAMHRGYRVIVVADACATRDLPGLGGTTIAARAIHESALAALADRFADVVTSETLLQLLAEPPGSVPSAQP